MIIFNEYQRLKVCSGRGVLKIKCTNESHITDTQNQQGTYHPVTTTSQSHEVDIFALICLYFSSVDVILY